MSRLVTSPWSMNDLMSGISHAAALHCLLPASAAAARLARRAAEGRDASDATAAIAGEIAHEFEPWPSATAVVILPPIEDVVPTVLDRLDAAVLRRTVGAGV